MASAASSGYTLIPIEAVTYSSVPSTSKGASNASSTRWATACAEIAAPFSSMTGDVWSRSASSIRNSSPPGRATRSVSRVASCRRAAIWMIRWSPDLVAERVVHELEVVDVEREHGDAAVGPARARERELEQLVEHRSVRHAGQAVVIGEIGEALLGLATLGDVEHHAVGVRGVAVGVSGA